MATKFEILLEILKKGKNPLLDTWPLFNDPLAVSIILATYAFVLHQGPKYMKDRKPFNLKNVILLYNAVQVCLNASMLIRTFIEPVFWKSLFSFGCAQLTAQEELDFNVLMCTGFWYMTMIKIMDLLDTVFFISCKKQSNVTVLHVQHHILTVAILWIFGKYFTGQELLSVFFCNTIVHVIMYFYYFLAALGPEFRKYLWWKKHLTSIQIIQFIIIISYMSASLWLSCGYDQKIVWIIIANTSLNFLNFYFNAYGNDSKRLIRDKMAVCGSLQFTNNYTEDIDIERKSL